MGVGLKKTDGGCRFGAPPESCLEQRYRAPALSEVNRVVLASSDNRRWFVLHTKARQEKSLADGLDAAGIENLLPLIRRVRVYGHRKRIVSAPLFPSYVFLKGDLDAAYFAVRTSRVARIVEVPDQGRFEHEVGQVLAALAAGGQLDAFAYLKEGRRARVRSGPFQGIEGLIDERLPRDRLILRVQALGRATGLEIDASLLEPMD